MNLTEPEKQIASRALELLKDEDAWIKGNNAEDANGYSCRHPADGPACWCVAGALAHAYWLVTGTNTEYDDLEDETYDLRKKLAPDYAGTLIDWNDDPNTCHGDVLDLLQRAIS